MTNNLINYILEITDELTINLIENKRIKNCNECENYVIAKVSGCTIYPAMTDMVECYKFRRCY